MLSWQAFLLIPPIVAPEPTLKQVERAYKILSTSDAPILAAAFKVKPDVLITWNTKHFFQTSVIKAAPFPVMIPGEFVSSYLNR